MTADLFLAVTYLRYFRWRQVRAGNTSAFAGYMQMSANYRFSNGPNFELFRIIFSRLSVITFN